MNYADHCREQNVPVPKEPIIFSKFASAIVGPYDNIILPPESQVGACPPFPHPVSLGLRPAQPTLHPLVLRTSRPLSICLLKLGQPWKLPRPSAQ